MVTSLVFCFKGDCTVKRQFCVILTAAIIAFAAGVGRGIEFSGPCDWKYNGYVSGCQGTTTLCQQGCNNACAGFSKVEYKNLRLVQSGGSNQKSTNKVSTPCKINKNCGHYSIGARRCTTDTNGVPDCSTVDVTSPSCSYCQVNSSNTVKADVYWLRTCG